MKNVLIVLSQADQSQLTVYESIQALLLFASFGVQISILFKDAGLSLLVAPPSINTIRNTTLNTFLKLGHQMLNSLEFYDIEHLYVLTKAQQNPLLTHCPYNIQYIQCDTAFLQQFQHVIYW